MINTGIGTGPSVVTIFTAKAWEELYELPPEARASCQASIMNAAEWALSGGESKRGLNGEHATLGDIAGFILYGPDVFSDAALDTKKHYTIPYVENVLKWAVDHGMDKDKAVVTYAGVRIYVGAHEFVSDCIQGVRNEARQKIHEPIKFIEEKAPEMLNAIEAVVGETFEKIMKDETLRKLVLPPIVPLPIGPDISF
jgi:hypothetical protein